MIICESIFWFQDHAFRLMYLVFLGYFNHYHLEALHYLIAVGMLQLSQVNLNVS